MASWSSPAEDGERTDLYYWVEHSDPDNLGSYINGAYLCGEYRNHTFSGLRPSTPYCVRVTFHNGVSDQDPDGINLRTVEECTTTLAARMLIFDTFFLSHCLSHSLALAPGVVTGVQGTYPYVVWNPPQEPNGVITGYRLVFSRSGTSTTRTVTTTSDQTFYIIQSSDIPWTSGQFRVTVSP